MPFTKFTDEKINNLAQFAFEAKGDWYQAANSGSQNTALAKKGTLLTQGFRENGIEAYVFVSPWSLNAKATSPKKTGTSRLVEISDQPEVAFAFAKALGTITHRKDVVTKFENKVRELQQNSASKEFSIGKDQTFTHRDAGINNTTRGAYQPSTSKYLWLS